MPLELDPPQPEPVLRAIEALLAPVRPEVDPWWAADVDGRLGAWVSCDCSRLAAQTDAREARAS